MQTKVSEALLGKSDPFTLSLTEGMQITPRQQQGWMTRGSALHSVPQDRAGPSVTSTKVPSYWVPLQEDMYFVSLALPGHSAEYS